MYNPNLELDVQVRSNFVPTLIYILIHLHLISWQQLPVDQRSTAADTMSSEAYWRVRDPVYGSAGLISMLQQEIHKVQRELAEIQAQIAVCQPARPPEFLYSDTQLNDHQFALDSINFDDFHQSSHFP